MAEKKAAAPAVEEKVLPAKQEAELETMLTEIETPRKVEEPNIPEVKTDELETLRKQIADTEKERDTLRTRAEQAERDREEYSRKYKEESTERVKAEGSSIDNNILANQAEADRLKRAIKEAADLGKLDEVADLTADYTAARLAIKAQEDKKKQFETMKSQRVQQNEQFEQSLSQFTPQTAAWIRAHPQFITDSTYNSVAVEAHNKAQRKGVTVDTPEYFRFVEKYIDQELNPTQVPTNDNGNTEEIVETPRQKTNVGALAPSRGGSGSSAQAQTVRLSADEVEMAALLYPKLSAADQQAKYYKNKMELKQEGRL